MREKLRRVFPVIATLALVLCIVAEPLSVSAGGISGVSDDEWFAALTFDAISYDCNLEYASTCTWSFPFNSSVQGWGEFKYGSSDVPDYVYGYSSQTDDPYFPTIVGAMFFPSLSPSLNSLADISFSGGQQIIQLSRVRDYTISFRPSVIVVSKAKLSGLYNVLKTDSGANSRYVVEAKSFNIDVSAVNGMLYIGQALADYFTDNLEKHTYVFLENIQFDIQFYRTDVSTTKFEFDIPTDGSNFPNDHINFGTWLLQYDTSVDITYVEPSYFDVTHWLSASVGSFLDFEIAPGFSLDKLFYIVLIIGVLIVFFKVFS